MVAGFILGSAVALFLVSRAAGEGGGGGPERRRSLGEDEVKDEEEEVEEVEVKEEQEVVLEEGKFRGRGEEGAGGRGEVEEKNGRWRRRSWR